MKRLLVLLVVSAVFIIGLNCSSASIADVKKRAAFEMGCSTADLAVAEIGEDTVGVSGCGKKYVYRRNCQNEAWGVGCKWYISTWREGSDRLRSPNEKKGK